MEKNNSYLPAAEGVLRGFIITVVLLLIFAVIMTFIDVSESVSSMFYLITTLLSIMYGAIYAVRKIKRRGWFIGILVTLLYLSILYIVSVISGNSAVIGTDRMLRFFLAVFVGALSGIIGINL
ncbi:TIGR04086 family membrane protein [Clostridium sp. A1-XYC3]|uniref:TIGR04086 family membrane protein n=1 Tax=Clostridium tanneri TaxID=3037988 RepID=A0ABU4JP64_9CLOT|nr:TIGR04086 family membrane protein [Clostridium sp. A1-XYC3]MDW8799920.1 TIGR04086 family membrane protein [Clostridium sp. A1-XYC3]